MQMLVQQTVHITSVNTLGLLCCLMSQTVLKEVHCHDYYKQN